MHPSRPGGALSLASLNLHGGMDRHGRPYDTEWACQQLRCEMIALQEVWRPARGPDPLAGVARALGGQVLHARLTARTSLRRLRVGPRTDPGDWGLAVITTRPVLSYHVIDLGRAPGDAVPRAAQVLTVASPGGGPVRVVNTHLTHRLTSPVQLVLLAGRLAAGSEPTVIAGDLNMPGPATLAASRYRRVLRAPTYPAHCPLIQLDHFLIGPGLHVESAEVLTGVGSDHLPIRAHLRLSDR